MSRRRTVAVSSLLVLAVSTCAALAQQPAPRAAKPAPALTPVATVGGRPIPQVDLDQRFQQVVAEYSQRRGVLPADMRDLVKRQVLEGLIRAELMTLEARRLGMVATVAEGEEALKQLPVFSPGGKFDAARYEGIKASQPQQFSAALTSVREQIAARKFAAETERKLSPSDADVRGAAARSLARVTLDLLPLRTSEFGSEGEEPRESQVVDWYRTHAASYRREARATLTIVFVNTPALPDSLKRSPSALSGWNDRMRAEADRILARVRQGEALDSVAAYLGPRGNIVVATDNFPGYWHGTPAQSARVFDPATKGQVLPEPVASNDGWLVVRVDDTTPAHVASLREVAREIRAQLRRENRLHRDENDARALYAQVRDSLAAPGWPIRYAAVDTGSFRIAEPGAGDLDTYFRAHQADYASFDPRSGSIVSRTFDEVKGDVRLRYLRDRRLLEARSLADQLLQAWTTGGKAAALEARLGARVTPPLVAHSRIDTGFVARALSDTIWSFRDPERGGMLTSPRGFIVWQALPRVARVVPTFEQAQDIVTADLAKRRAAADDAGAHALYDADPLKFGKGRTIHFTRVNFAPRAQISVPLTREEVLSWHKAHLERYSAPEMVTAKHILVAPTGKTAAADQQALAKAKELLRRIKGGEDFTTLARAYSDDPATRDIGGDLGTLAHGALLEPIEKVAFSLPAGTLYDQPIRTVLGYHILKVSEHLPPEIKPLPTVYGSVAADAATDKANRITLTECDSLLRAVRDPKAFASAGTRAGAEVAQFEIGTSEQTPNPDAEKFFLAVQATAPGHIVSGSFPVKGQGAWCGVVDSITAGRVPPWEEARQKALEEYRREGGSRALVAKRAELDSLVAQGVSLDSLAACWGGLQRVTDYAPGRALPFTGTTAESESLLFGGRKGEPGLPVGGESGWVQGAMGIARLRCVSRVAPTSDQLSERADQMRRTEIEQKVLAYTDELKKRYPVVILDRKLREVTLLGPPPVPQAP